MFGDEEIYGQFIIPIDDKNRISLPKVTKRENGDILNIVYDEDLELYRIYNANIFNEKLEYLSCKITDATNKQEEIIYKKKYLEFAKSVLRSGKVDKQGRFTIGNILSPNKNVYAIGAKDHLILERSLIKKEK